MKNFIRKVLMWVYNAGRSEYTFVNRHGVRITITKRGGLRANTRDLVNSDHFRRQVEIARRIPLNVPMDEFGRPAREEDRERYARDDDRARSDREDVSNDILL